MEAKDLKNLSISALILVILNEDEPDGLRRWAEVELRKRIKSLGWDYDDLLHFDDKAIQKRGLESENYLISPDVNMQQLMDTYFAYCHEYNQYQDQLLFSEKHLCNNIDFAHPFFRQVCEEEIINLEHRIKDSNDDVEKEHLTTAKQALEKRNVDAREARREGRAMGLDELLITNEASFQLEDHILYHYINNISEQDAYNKMRTALGRLGAKIGYGLDETLFDMDLMQSLYAYGFVKKDSRKLHKQKLQLMKQVRNGFIVDYHSEPIEMALKRENK